MSAALPWMSADPGLDSECINPLRFLAVDAVQKPDNAHPGIPMGAASMAYVLRKRFHRWKLCSIWSSEPLRVRSSY